MIKDNVPAIPKYQYDIPNMYKWLITLQLLNINKIYKLRKNNRRNNC